MPKKGPNPKTIEKINEVLKENSKGIWIREISRKTQIPKSTVHYYIEHYFQNKTENVFVGKGNLFKIIKLRRLE